MESEHNPVWCLEHAIIYIFSYANCGVCLLHVFLFCSIYTATAVELFVVERSAEKVEDEHVEEN